MANPDAKKERARRQARLPALRETVSRLFVCTYLLLQKEEFHAWMTSTRGFSDLLRRLGREWFGERRDAQDVWEMKLLCFVSDLAEREMTTKEWKRRSIATPREILDWFAEFLEERLPRKELLLDSPLFSRDVIAGLLEELEKLEKQPSKNPQEVTHEPA